MQFLCFVWLLVLPSLNQAFHLGFGISILPRSKSILRNSPLLDQEASTSTLCPEIFCNTELNGFDIDAVGFDMDFTLAQYKDCFDYLAFEGAKAKLCSQFGYPKEILEFEYDSSAFQRGILIDKKAGNFLKLDRNNYVKTVYHGLTEVDSKIRKMIYSQNVPSFSESHFQNIDTIFTLIDAYLFACMVDFADSHRDMISKSYEQIYREVSQCIDLSHRDGVIKDKVMQDPESYIKYDENLVPMLRRLRAAGKKVFLLTNSLFNYTNEVMEFLVHGRGNYSDIDWKDLFDIIVVGACKPSYLNERRLSMFEVDPRDGSLKNLEAKELVPAVLSSSQSKVFQGGSWEDLHRLLEIPAGNRVMYVGDHVFADILRSKRVLGWRTCLIIPELDHELEKTTRESSLYEEIWKLRNEQNKLDSLRDLLQMKLLDIEDPKLVEKSLIEQLEHVNVEWESIRRKLRKLSKEYDKGFNEKWGQLFKAGLHDSRFAKQVMDYACLYTSRATNLVNYHPNRSFRPNQEMMPHDMQCHTSVCKHVQ